MKKTKPLFLPLITLACACIFYSCTSDDIDHPEKFDSGATWTLGTQPFSSDGTDVNDSDMYLHASGGSTDGIFVKFGSDPHDRGAAFNYHIVDYNKTSLAYNEVAIEIDHGVSDVWLSTGGSGSEFANTYLNGDEVRLKGANIPVRHYASNGPQSDSTLATFDIGTR